MVALQNPISISTNQITSFIIGKIRLIGQFECLYFVMKTIIYRSVGWFGLWCLTPLSTIFQSYRDGQFYWWRKPPTCSKSLTLSLNVVSSRPRLCRMLVVIGTDCICSFNPTTIRSRLWWHRLFYIINQRFEQKITCLFYIINQRFEQKITYNIKYLESKGSLLVVCCNKFLFLPVPLSKRHITVSCVLLTVLLIAICKCVVFLRKQMWIWWITLKICSKKTCNRKVDF